MNFAINERLLSTEAMQILTEAMQIDGLNLLRVAKLSARTVSMRWLVGECA